jgi:hypothetical protein
LQYSDIKKAQAADIGGICGLIVDILKGSAKTNVDEPWQADDTSRTPIHLQLLGPCLDKHPGVTRSLATLCECNADTDQPSLESVFHKLEVQHQEVDKN